MSKADKIFQEAFSKARDPRSEEYRNGVINTLKFRLGEVVTFEKCRYPIGTAQADAYFAGCEEGHQLAGEHLEGVKK